MISPKSSNSPTITSKVELFSPAEIKYKEVSLIDCNDSFTYNLVQAFLKLGAPVRVFRSHEVSVTQVCEQLGHYLVLSPGPGTPDEGGIAKSLYDSIRGTLPVLGVCLGMQTINEIFGGKTVASPQPVHGKISMINHNEQGIFSGISNPTPVARYHSLRIEPGSELIEIQSEYNDVIMAFRINSARTVAVQFHPESFLTKSGMLMLTNFLEGNI